jgi:hypothetical protein
VSGAMDQGSAISSFIEWGFKAIVSLVGAVGAYLWVSLVKDVKDMEKQHKADIDSVKRDTQEVAYRLADYKEKASEKFADKTEMQSLREEIRELFGEVRKDIRELRASLKVTL